MLLELSYVAVFILGNGSFVEMDKRYASLESCKEDTDIKVNTNPVVKGAMCFYDPEHMLPRHRTWTYSLPKEAEIKEAGQHVTTKEK